jgi:tetratricopeptide (TPR) repeat protein
MELYDTKTSKVLWSESWQKRWNELASIKGNLAENILKTLDVSSKQNISKAPTNNADAYEYYLKAKYKWEKSKNVEDNEIARELLRKSLEIDDNLLVAKILLGRTYLGYIAVSPAKIEIIDLDLAMDIFEKVLIQAEELGDNFWKGRALRNIGNVYSKKFNYDLSLDYYNRSLLIGEEINDMDGVQRCLHNLGMLYWEKADLDKSLIYFTKSLKTADEFGSEYKSIQITMLGHIHSFKGEYDKALNYYTRSLKEIEESSDKRWMGFALNNIGCLYHDMGNYKKTIEYFEKSLSILKAQGNNSVLYPTTYLYLAYKKLGKKYDIEIIHTLFKEYSDRFPSTDMKLYHSLFRLLEDKSYLETAYNQVQEKVDNLEPDVAAKFLNYPIPKAIVEEWEKVK